jgi:hypothetical protein
VDDYERTTLNNLITEVRLRAAPILQGLTDSRAFGTNLRNGIIAYSY